MRECDPFDDELVNDDSFEEIFNLYRRRKRRRYKLIDKLKETTSLPLFSESGISSTFGETHSYSTPIVFKSSLLRGDEDARIIFFSCTILFNFPIYFFNTLAS